MTKRQAQRAEARAAEGRRETGSYHHGEETVVVSFRATRAWVKAMKAAMDSSTDGIGGGAFGTFVQHHAGKSAMFKWGRTE
jgi:dihydroxyacetone kinase